MDKCERLMNVLLSACAKELIVRSYHVIYAQEVVADLAAANARIAALEAQLAERVKIEVLKEVGKEPVPSHGGPARLVTWKLMLNGIEIERESARYRWDYDTDSIDNPLERKAELLRSALEATPPTPEVTEVHPDDLAVDRFAIAMKAKLTEKRAEGRRGWDDPAECSAGYLSMLLVEHIEKGDPLDVGNLAMMLHERGDRIADERERYAAKRAALTAAQEAGKP